MTASDLGYKLGLTSLPMQQLLGWTHRTSDPCSRPGVFNDGAVPG